jgi:hypothetical protein
MVWDTDATADHYTAWMVGEGGDNIDLLVLGGTFQSQSSQRSSQLTAAVIRVHL